MLFYSFDLDTMTLILKRDLDVAKMYLYSQNEVPCYSDSSEQADRHANKLTDRIQIGTQTHRDRPD